MANSTAAANLEKAKNRAAELQQTMGEQLYPVYLQCIEGAASLSKVLASIVLAISRNKIEFGLLAAVVALLTLNITIANKQTKIAIALKRTWQALALVGSDKEMRKKQIREVETLSNHYPMETP